MAEKVVRAEAVLVDWLCDDCGEPVARDERKPDYTSTPIQIPHTCPNGHRVMLPDGYPKQGMRRL